MVELAAQGDLVTPVRRQQVRIGIAADVAQQRLVIDAAECLPVEPRHIGKIDKVAAWWKSKVDEIYRAIPDFAGFLVKADSEGQAGPSTYGRTHADAANVLANALKPHGGVLVYDPSDFTPEATGDYVTYAVPFNEIARKQVQLFQAKNMVMLGAICGLFVPPLEAMVNPP